jgi:hypothetical protein
MAETQEYDGPRTRVKLEVVGRDADGTETGRYCNDNDLITQQWAQWVGNNIFGVAQTIKDETATGRSETAWATLSALTIQAGTSVTAASVTDTALGTITPGVSGTCAGTLSAISESSGTSGSFTITGTITNSSGSTVNYSELGITLNDASAHVFLLTHDVFTAVPVSTTGTLAITYTITNS